MNRTNDQTPSRPTIPNPREFMQARHPDLFSDTQVDDVSQLPRPVFEYHLDTLTSRKQEYELEHFCRKIAEKESWSNLRPQTGPTGGGDGKVDTETYSVAKEIVERWWIGSPSAGAERWAFAFSAKKEWKAKIKANIENILSMGRDYKRVYFFTNQFVSDKQRADQEDALSKHAKIPVHIIDRAWIVEKVYEADHLDLSIAALGIEGARSERISRPGPRDTERLTELEELGASSGLRHRAFQRTGPHHTARRLEFGNDVFADKLDGSHDLLVVPVESHNTFIRSKLLVTCQPLCKHIWIAYQDGGLIAQPVEVSRLVVDLF